MKTKKSAIKRITALLCLCFSFTFIYAQKSIAGIWEGKLNAGSVSLRMVFHFEKSP